MGTELTFIDIIILIIIFISSILAMLRGFTREILAIFSWITALSVAFFAWVSDYTRNFATDLIKPDWLAYTILVGTIFIIALIISSFIASRLSKLILRSGIGSVDRILGLLFGATRGYILILAVYSLFTWAIPENYPDQLKKSKFQPVLESSQNIIKSNFLINPSKVIDKLTLDIENIEEKINPNVDPSEVIEGD